MIIRTLGFLKFGISFTTAIIVILSRLYILLFFPVIGFVGFFIIVFSVITTNSGLV